MSKTLTASKANLAYPLGNGGICPKCKSTSTTFNPKYKICACETCENIWNAAKDQEVDYGFCCACHYRKASAVKLMNFEGSPSGCGWGCETCGLPNDGAIAVVCKTCATDKATVTQVVKEFLYLKRRIEINQLITVPFNHKKKH